MIVSRCAVVAFRAQKGLKTEEGVEKLFADPAREAPAEPDNRVPNPNPGSDDVYIGSGKYIKVSGVLSPSTHWHPQPHIIPPASHPSCWGGTHNTD